MRLALGGASVPSEMTWMCRSIVPHATHSRVPRGYRTIPYFPPDRGFCFYCCSSCFYPVLYAEPALYGIEESILRHLPAEMTCLRRNTFLPWCQPLPSQGTGAAASHRLGIPHNMRMYVQPFCFPPSPIPGFSSSPHGAPTHKLIFAVSLVVLLNTCLRRRGTGNGGGTANSERV